MNCKENDNVGVAWSAAVPEKKPERTVAAAAPAAPADDTPLLSLKTYSRCGTSAGTHTAATRDGRGRGWGLEKTKKNKSPLKHSTFSILNRNRFKH